jgi:hypothetical protein
MAAGKEHDNFSAQITSALCDGAFVLDFQIDEVIQFMSKFAYMLTNVD